LDALFATETMAELSARQGRVADAIAIYRHLVLASQGAASPDVDEDARVARWRARVAELESRSAGATAPVASTAPPPETPPRAQRDENDPPRVVPDAAPRATLVIHEPVRSGQVIYAEGRDLIVVASVNAGAQVLADGNVHVYGGLKGRAVAGAHGARDAQVFCLSLEPELVGVDIGYMLSDDVPQGLWGCPARVFLTSEGTCSVVELTAGKRNTGVPAKLARRFF
jgi:septum site-determining protein MinC